MVKHAASLPADNNKKQKSVKHNVQYLPAVCPITHLVQMQLVVFSVQLLLLQLDVLCLA